MLTGFNFGGTTEGLLGVWLAQRQAALRGMVAAGRGLKSIVTVRADYLRALRMPDNSFWKSGVIGIGRIALG